MLSEQIVLPFGFSLSLGAFLILFKYLYSAGFCLWAVSLFRWRRTSWFLVGGLGLCLLGFAAVQAPLNRAYGLEDSSEFLPGLADSMVTAATGSTFDGWRLGSPNYHPVWSVLVASLSGFDPIRLRASAAWLGVLAILSFSALTLLGLRLLERTTDHRDDTSPGGREFAVFFALFLSSGQLDFLEERYLYWPQVFLIESYRALSLPLVLVAGGLLLASSRFARGLGALTLGILANLDPDLFLIAAGVTIVTALVSGRAKCLASLPGAAFGLALGIPQLFRLSSDPWLGIAAMKDATGTGLLSRLETSLLVPSPLVFLSLIAIIAIVRKPMPGHRFAVVLTAGCIVGTVGSGLGVPWFETSSVPLLLRDVVSLLAGYGFHGLLVRFRRTGADTARLRDRGLWVTVGLFFLLPWTFFYWWQPRTMDPVFRDGLSPVSPRLERLAAWVTKQTPRESVFLVSKNLGPWLPAFTGRRVLVADEPPREGSRDDIRLTLEALDRGNPSSVGELRRLGITHVVVLRTDLERSPQLDDLLARTRMLRQVHSVARWAKVYAVVTGLSNIGGM